MEGNNINDSGAVMISNMLGINTSLREVNLINNKIKDKGARALGKIIAKIQSIKITIIKNFIITGCYHNTVYHMINLGK